MSYEHTGMGALTTAKRALTAVKSTSKPAALPTVPKGNVRVPQGERKGLKAWHGRFHGTMSATHKNHLSRDPNFTFIEPAVLEKFRKARRRAELIAAKNGVWCLSGGQRDKAIKVLRWWARCDKIAWAAWNPVTMAQASYGECVAVPKSLLDYWVQDWSLRRSENVACPTGVLDGVSFKDELFGFNAMKTEAVTQPRAQAMFLGAMMKFTSPGTPDEASAQAAEEAVEAARQAEDEMDLVGNGEMVYRGEEEMEVGAPGNGRLLMWGAVGLVAVGGIGYVVWKYVLGPKQMAANPKDRWQGAVNFKFDGSWEYDDIVRGIGRRLRGEDVGSGTELTTWIRDIEFEFKSREKAQAFVRQAKAALRRAGAKSVSGSVVKVTW